MVLVAVRPDLQGKGVNSLLMKAMAEARWKNGIKIAHLNPQLENNLKVRSQWKHFGGKIRNVAATTRNFRLSRQKWIIIIH